LAAPRHARLSRLAARVARAAVNGRRLQVYAVGPAARRAGRTVHRGVHAARTRVRSGVRARAAVASRKLFARRSTGVEGDQGSGTKQPGRAHEGVSVSHG
jgi:hypothetical protein